MKKLSIFILFFFSCKNISENNKYLKNVSEIDYTFDNGWKEAYSIKISADGRCIVGNGRWKIKYYYSQLSGENISKIDSLISVTPFEKYDSLYYEDQVDQSSYKIVLVGFKKDTIKKFVYGRKAPQKLNDFANCLNSIKEKLQITLKDTVVDFISREKFYLLPVGKY
jgi:hypothetical protein